MNRLAVVVGNPKPESRTLSAARALATRIGEPSLVVDLAAHEIADFGSLAGEFAAHDVLVVASPTYHGTFTGLLKLFLDQVPYKGLTGRIGVPLMVGAGPGHALAADLYLPQVLRELGAVTPAPSLYVLEKSYDDPVVYDEWAATALPLIPANAVQAV